MIDKDHALAVLLDAVVDVAFDDGEMDGAIALGVLERAGLAHECAATVDDAEAFAQRGYDCEVGDMIHVLTDGARVILRAARKSEAI